MDAHHIPFPSGTDGMNIPTNGLKKKMLWEGNSLENAGVLSLHKCQTKSEMVVRPRLAIPREGPKDRKMNRAATRRVIGGDGRSRRSVQEVQIQAE